MSTIKLDIEPVEKRSPRHDSEPVTDVHLVGMPWPPLDSPYLALGTLAGYVGAADSGREVEQWHLYLNWYRLLKDKFGDAALEVYATVAEDGAYLGVGDFVFARRNFPASGQHVSEFTQHCERNGVAVPWLADLRDLGEIFVDLAARELAEHARPGSVVGLSSTFTQTVPSLALITALKRLRPDLVTILGGGNMNSDRGAVLLKTVPELDAVVYGEGEATLLALVRQLDEGGPLSSRSGLVTRSPSSAPRSGRSHWVPLDDNPLPDMGSYFEQLSETGLDAEIEPRLAFEIGRGCWWGEKHHCTFCGLNGESMAFRRKTRPDVHSDILELIERYQVLDVIFADNILHPADLAAVFDKLPADLDLRMHLEVKANLKRSEIQRLRTRGVWHMQPGIESLARRPLELMRKGTTPWQNIRFLRDAEELGVTTSWNILTGFPTEQLEDYTEMLRQIPRLHHLQPPGGVGVLGLVRYSPLFNDPELGVPHKRPTPDTSWTYAGLTPSDIETMSDVFDSDGVFDVGKEVVELLRPLTDEWRQRHTDTFLVEERAGESITITRSERGNATSFEMREAWAVALWEQLRIGKTPAGLRRYLDQSASRDARLSTELIEALDVEHNVLYRDEGTIITLPTRYEDHIPYRIAAS
jgi:ribosomal peptide maturation radical SAM protein 1